ncbi:isocitrate lyase/PEP mutase family protein [Aspergillus neoniger CBS 115656]|uniref:Carboxyphosphonoenolpyruvate mutase n=1 Tax=Aspergillus neoniger (strain CBS 115656) TaxID=1448310 RepID=A0A318YAU7_ASPNB|nr:carboxyphosphonoenolpyruvate mutase [Aspergillus neoniger CBS 115656]PYH31471.1 carboxyphosphonoenolpyruvate mutase [Aspergillus neoniger CBS 115656]
MAIAPAVTKLRQLLADESKIIVCPGVYDGFTARIALQEGFDALYMTGAGTTASRLGQPDLGVVTLNEMRGNAEMIANLDPTVPLIADADTGFGGSLMVHRTVTEYIRAGVAALHLEDQPTSKRCGHLRNKQLVPEDEYLDRIQAAVNARARSQSDIVLIARTDALQSLGYDAAISRLKGAIALGADVAFLEGITSTDQARQVCEELKPTPVLFNNVPGGVSPDLSVQQAQELGFRLIIFPGLALGAVYSAVRGAVQQLKQTGTQAVRAGGSPRDLFNVLGLQEAVALDLASGGRLYDRGV